MSFNKLFKNTEFWLIVLAAIVLGVRLYLSFQSPNFNYDGYFTLRQAQNIRDTGLPLYKDPLSYGGKVHMFAPLYYYTIAFFGLFMNIETAAKIVPNLFAALIVIMIYFIALKITKNQKVSFITSFMSAFIPIMFFDINSITLDYLAILLILSIIYCIFRINERRFVDYCLILIFLLVLTTPLAFILILGLLFYLLLLRLENMQIEMKELEIILFLTFMVFWVNLLIYKNAFLTHGLLVVRQNTPTQILNGFFSRLTSLEALYSVSIIPLLLGIYGFYSVFYKEKNKHIMLIVGLALSSFLLLWFKFLDLVSGLIFLSIALVIGSSYAMKTISEFIDKTKLHKQKKPAAIIMLVLFAASAIWPSMIIGLDHSRMPTSDDIDAMKWSATNLPKNITIAATLDEGDMVAYYAMHKNIMDKNYLLTPNIDQRLDDLNLIFTSKFENDAVKDLNLYRSRYIFFSEHAALVYGISNPAYVSDKDCFDEIYYQGNASLYFVKCRFS